MIHQKDSLIPLERPINEPIKNYAPGDASRESLKKRLDEMSRENIEIPCIIGGKEIRTGNTRKVVMPHAHQEQIGTLHWGGDTELKLAVKASQKAKKDWENLHWTERAAVFQKAAELLSTTWRDTINAATMLGQSKNAFQSEIDAACEMIDFFKFNNYFYQQIIGNQPLSANGVWNQVDYRPLEGFVLAITPFNFTAIAGNLCASPALTGNTVVWKPSDTQALSAYYTYQLFKAAGLPDGVINLVPADGPVAGAALLGHPDLAGVHFTGSTQTFQNIWKTIGNNISEFKSYPRVVGETGGKDFVFAHPNCDEKGLVTALIRGAFEYQGQKCSAASRAYIPQSIWNRVKENLIAEVKKIKVGDVRDFSHFVNAVIDERAFNRIQATIEKAKSAPGNKLLFGGECNKEKGYFISPTIILTTDPKSDTMVNEIFGPVLTIFVYDDGQPCGMEDALQLVDSTSPYALTGAVFANDRVELAHILGKLRNSAGNIYINDKPTGAVVGQQPFGGARASGTNDKAGSYLNLVRWISPRTIKETFVSPHSFGYPFMG